MYSNFEYGYYGFICKVPWQDRIYDVQVAYRGTDSWDRYTVDLVLDYWGSDDTSPSGLAQYELDHRDWSSTLTQRIGVAFVEGGWLDSDDPYKGNRPLPPEKEILQEIAAGKATDFVFGWEP